MKINIRKKASLYGELYNVAILFVLISIAGQLLDGDYLSDKLYINPDIRASNIVFFLGLVFVLVRIFRLLLNRRNLSSRSEKLFLAAAARNMRSQWFALSRNMHSLSEDTQKFRYVTTKNSFFDDAEQWGFCDYEFTRFRRTRRGTYDAYTVFFAVGVFDLPRKLPNVVFDSRATGGREFKVLLDDDQKHSLESTFDTYFTTYFHQSYTIDSLSFITPDVMEMLIEAQNYDIEIYEDKLYLYNELENMPHQLEDVRLKGHNIRNKLLNNITTYRDERVDFEHGRSSVSILGLHLKRSLTGLYVKSVMGIVIILAAVVFSVYLVSEGFSPINQFSAYVFIIGLSMVSSSKRKMRQIKEEETYAETHQETVA